MQIASGKLTASHFSQSNIPSFLPKKKAKTSIWNINSENFDFSGIKCISKLLQGKEICVFSGFKNIKKLDLEKKIIEFGGKLVKNPGI